MRNVGGFIVGRGSLERLPAFVDARREAVGGGAKVVYLVDSYFANQPAVVASLGAHPSDVVRYVDATDEPTTDGIDAITSELRGLLTGLPATIVGFGGGTTMDTAKAVANLLTNTGAAADYQGWDLVKVAAVHKIAVPTISGTGSEATRTCVMTNTKTGLKLGMNSDYTIFDQMVLDLLELSRLAAGVATSTPSQINSSIRVLPSMMMPILAVWRVSRSSDTSLIASCTVSDPSTQSARISNGLITAPSAAASRAGRSSAE